MNKIEQKMNYLQEIRQIDVRTNDDIKRMNERINRVCDSIEADLGIGTTNVKPSHQCIGCGHQEHGINPIITDGLRCPECDDSLVPIGSLPSRQYPPGSNK